MKKRLRMKKDKQHLQEMMLSNVWDGSYQEKKKIFKMSWWQMEKALNEEWRNQTGWG
ncbi:hypothetical protein [Streptococcus salivarius]|uniref:hypothetical protein n=1 Tax=Streptococcus salivarius TaxID=1304 RepID=UPI0015D21AD2|nr:hypothetical protein [Streptococcus salivarius]